MDFEEIHYKLFHSFQALVVIWGEMAFVCLQFHFIMNLVIDYDRIFTLLWWYGHMVCCG